MDNVRHDSKFVGIVIAAKQEIEPFNFMAQGTPEAVVVKLEPVVSSGRTVRELSTLVHHNVRNEELLTTFPLIYPEVVTALYMSPTPLVLTPSLL